MQITLRVTPDTYEGMKAAASAEGRSLNKQIERVLEAWLRQWRQQEPEHHVDELRGNGGPSHPSGPS